MEKMNLPGPICAVSLHYFMSGMQNKKNVNGESLGESQNQERKGGETPN